MLPGTPLAVRCSLLEDAMDTVYPHCCGLDIHKKSVASSFIPPVEQRELRDLTRHRTSLVQDRARVVNRLQKVLEDTNVKLGDVATDILG